LVERVLRPSLAAAVGAVAVAGTVVDSDTVAAVAAAKAIKSLLMPLDGEAVLLVGREKGLSWKDREPCQATVRELDEPNALLHPLRVERAPFDAPAV